MDVQQYRWQTGQWEPETPSPSPTGSPDLVLVFGCPNALIDTAALEDLNRAFPDATHFGCSSAGEIFGTSVTDGALVATAVRFEHTQLRGAAARVADFAGSEEIGRHLGASLAADNLQHVLVLSDGLQVNGTDLVAGLTQSLPSGTTVSGGLSADAGQFEKTFVLLNSAPEMGVVAALGFYGSRLKVGCGSLGGWDPFGPERLITRSASNVLYELDGRSVLALYKQYLGEHAKGLPATGLLFPLSLRGPGGDVGVVHTVLSIDEAEQSMTFAGDMPEGHYARFMKANIDRLIDGAVGAAQRSDVRDRPAELAILISCYGRKMVLKDLVEEEVEGVREALGNGVPLIGMYSYGEIAPFAPGSSCVLHNQTMTVTTLAEG